MHMVTPIILLEPPMNRLSAPFTLPVFAAAVLALAAPAGAEEQGAACSAFPSCHKSHAGGTRECPQCERHKSKISSEDAACSSCAARAHVCRHCGLPRGTGASGSRPSGGASAKAAPANPFGRPRPVSHEVVLPVQSASHGALDALFCRDRIELSGGLPPKLPAAPFLITMTSAQEGSVDGLVALLKKKLGADVAKVAIEIRERGETYNRIAKRIKEKEPRLVVGGCGLNAIHDRAALRAFNADSAPADFVSGNFFDGANYGHQNYKAGDTKMFGSSKIQFDTIYDISACIAGAINYPSGRKLALIGYGWRKDPFGTSPEERAYTATVVVNFAAVNLQRLNRTEGKPLVLWPLPAEYADVIRSGHEVLWPKARGDNGEPWDFVRRAECNTMPVTGIATRDPATRTIHVLAVNNSTAHVKAKLSVPGKGDADLYFDPCEVKVLRF
jgi:hypothetical protein